MRLDQAIRAAQDVGSTELTRGDDLNILYSTRGGFMEKDILATDWEVVRPKPLEVWLCNRTGNGSLKECVRPSEGSHNQRLFREVL